MKKFIYVGLGILAGIILTISVCRILNNPKNIPSPSATCDQTIYWDIGTWNKRPEEKLLTIKAVAFKDENKKIVDENYLGAVRFASTSKTYSELPDDYQFKSENKGMIDFDLLMPNESEFSIVMFDLENSCNYGELDLSSYVEEFHPKK